MLRLRKCPSSGLLGRGGRRQAAGQGAVGASGSRRRVSGELLRIRVRREARGVWTLRVGATGALLLVPRAKPSVDAGTCAHRMRSWNTPALGASESRDHEALAAAASENRQKAAACPDFLAPPRRTPESVCPAGTPTSGSLWTLQPDKTASGRGPDDAAMQLPWNRHPP